MLLNNLAKKLCSSQLQNDIHEAKIDSGNVLINSESLKIYKDVLSSLQNGSEVLKDLGHLRLIVEYGKICFGMKLIDNTFWNVVLGLKFSFEESSIYDNRILIECFDKGLQNNDDDSWKYLKILVSVSENKRSRNVIKKLIQTKFKKRIGNILDRIEDLQQLYFLLYLITSNFPREIPKSRSNLVYPHLWEDNEKTNLFFSNAKYPTISQLNTKGIFEFIWEVFSKMLPKISLITKIGCDNLKNGKQSCLFKLNKFNIMGIVQYKNSKMFLWVSDLGFVESRRDNFDYQKSTDKSILITFKNNKSNILNIFDVQSYNRLCETTHISLAFANAKECSQLIDCVSYFPKISEAETYLKLSYTEEKSECDPEMTKNEYAQKGNEYVSQNNPVSSSVSPEDYQPSKLENMRNDVREKSMLVTPEKSECDKTDIWDIIEVSEPSSNEIKENELKKAAITIDDSPKLIPVSHNMNVPDLESKTPSEKITNKVRNESLMVTSIKKINNPKNTDTFIQPTIELSNKKKNVISDTVKPIVVNKDIQALDAIFAQTNLKAKAKVKKVSKGPSKRKIKKQSNLKIPKKNEFKSNTGVKNKVEVSEQVSIDEITSHEIENESDLKDKALRNEKLESTSASTESTEKVEKHDPVKTGIDQNEDKNSALTNEKPASVNDNLESTTIYEAESRTSDIGIAFTHHLQNQINDSINKFTNDFTRKLEIINTEFNKKVTEDLLQKYDLMFQHLRRSFDSDTREMVQFVGEVKNLMNLSEEELTITIRGKKIGHTPH